jgi:hypothetical protein
MRAEKESLGVYVVNRPNRDNSSPSKCTSVHCSAAVIERRGVRRLSTLRDNEGSSMMSIEQETGLMSS